MVARGEERQTAFLRTKEQPNIEGYSAFEVILSKATNAQARMKVRFPKSVANSIDCPRYFAPARFREFPNIPAKRV
jgi:hypothetical protein